MSLLSPITPAGSHVPHHLGAMPVCRVDWCTGTVTESQPKASATPAGPAALSHGDRIAFGTDTLVEVQVSPGTCQPQPLATPPPHHASARKLCQPLAAAVRAQLTPRSLSEATLADLFLSFAEAQCRAIEVRAPGAAGRGRDGSRAHHLVSLPMRQRRRAQPLLPSHFHGACKQLHPIRLLTPTGGGRGGT
jgi:hypothetical protein